MGRKRAPRRVRVELTRRQWELVLDRLGGVPGWWHPKSREAFEEAMLEIGQAAGGVV